jgi:predicted GIY-YIG superfamily endonuclease
MHTAQHYIGYTDRSLTTRLAEHQAGQGARIIEVAIERGITFTCVRTWDGTRTDERRLKNWKNARRYLCPICMKIASTPEERNGTIQIEIPF